MYRRRPSRRRQLSLPSEFRQLFTATSWKAYKKSSRRENFRLFNVYKCVHVTIHRQVWIILWFGLRADPAYHHGPLSVCFPMLWTLVAVFPVKFQFWNWCWGPQLDLLERCCRSHRRGTERWYLCKYLPTTTLVFAFVFLPHANLKLLLHEEAKKRAYAREKILQAFIVWGQLSEIYVFNQ